MRRVFVAILVLLVVLDFFVHKHPPFLWEAIPSFNAVYGFISCVVIIVVSNFLGRWLKKREDYYDS